jgi:hypothetical protein
VHEKIQDKKCQLCDYAASGTAKLSKHVKTVHSKIKDMKCLNCDYTSAKCSNLITHIKAVHEKIRGKKCLHCIKQLLIHIICLLTSRQCMRKSETINVHIVIMRPHYIKMCQLTSKPFMLKCLHCDYAAATNYAAATQYTFQSC